MLLWLQEPGWTTQYAPLAVLAGLTLLVLGAELLVRGAVFVALSLGMSRMTVGLTLVAIGTSLPELLVSVTAARSGRNAIALANVLGSNIANVLLIVGTAAAIRAISLRTRWLELGYMLLMTALMSVPFVFEPVLGRVLGAVMVATLTVFCAHLLLRERAARSIDVAEDPPQAGASGWAAHLLMLGGGFAMLAYGAEWLVEGAVAIALNLGMSEPVVGLTIVAIGTSLPELATSAVAAIRGQPEICIGNVIGSNIFNVGAVLGVAGLIQPIPIQGNELPRYLIVAAAAAVAMTLVLRWRRGVPRFAGIVFLLVYFGVLSYEVAMSGKA